MSGSPSPVIQRNYCILQFLSCWSGTKRAENFTSHLPPYAFLALEAGEVSHALTDLFHIVTVINHCLCLLLCLARETRTTRGCSIKAVHGPNEGSRFQSVLQLAFRMRERMRALECIDVVTLVIV